MNVMYQENIVVPNGIGNKATLEPIVTKSPPP
jgi:hypothetical protein